LRDAVHAPVMSSRDRLRTCEPRTTDDVLAAEIERYLDAIALFRELGCEPAWLPETPSGLVVRVQAALDPFEQRVSRR
jgi:hypothetical protein